MKFKHIILSRVNVPRVLDSHKYDTPAPYLSEKWNLERIRLLNKYLRPSLRKQTNQDFTLITLWHKYYGFDHSNRLGNEYQIIIERGYDKEDEAYFDFAEWEKGNVVKETMDFWKQIRDKTKPFTGETTLVTNCDSDDALHYRFVERLQDHAKDYTPPFYLDCGMRYAINDKNGKTGIKNSSGVSPASSSLESEYECYPLKYHHSFIGNHLSGKKFKDLQVLQSISGNNIYCGSIGKPVNVNVKEFI